MRCRRHGLWPRNYLQVVVNGVWSLDVERGAHSERGFGGYLKSTKRHFYDTRMEVPLKFSFPEWIHFDLWCGGWSVKLANEGRRLGPFGRTDLGFSFELLLLTWSFVAVCWYSLLKWVFGDIKSSKENYFCLKVNNKKMFYSKFTIKTNSTECLPHLAKS